jgi:hypothetical protein
MRKLMTVKLVTRITELQENEESTPRPPSPDTNKLQGSSLWNLQKENMKVWGSPEGSNFQICALQLRVRIPVKEAFLQSPMTIPES